VEIKRSLRDGCSLGILFSSPDHLAEDSNGGSARKETLQHVAAVLEKSTRDTDVLARFSETEFALTLGGADIETSLFVAEKTPKIDPSRAMPASGRGNWKILVVDKPGAYRQCLVKLLREVGSVQY
jgi:GGDEF domain-containing protein